MQATPRLGSVLALALALAAAAIGAAPRAAAPRAGTISGRVEVRQAGRPAGPRPSVHDLGAASPAATAPDAFAYPSVVYLETAPLGAFDQREGAVSRARMDQRHETFVPHVLAITTGTTVDFPNNDGIYHNVFSLSKTGRFDLGRYAAGHSRSVRFDRPGVVRVFCEIHSHMNAFILVFAHPFFAVTGDEGRYRLDRVPPGAYRVVAWHEGTATDARPVVVPEGGGAELDFTIP